ncbi:hypothetical protein COW36_15970 [bacterium (Candidatus Blackallbacteria) CG17_big_fil_post_rev_8_21_14_2_50_48_46]|uniref:YHYH domain-containing protein n=1 Tax=bacterium (Candidatus Blackallbacteria) CG17_big_fil_post_rev_8_21_14_2_50_48_46 TaxID=2014261 RepID=A0A2M7G1X1_9BACT|nr:MAG: hypothetical protein COW64_09120 [bacterium (Candidatus Blackallbacteria) CG18_big_fil_WC_8_21_14_2_50_49_26]PIW15765.1 MAG: hypothetical protein COW36_15970 [bacterium (Candidatus Blackallbacteria) CG17_big_fil_post_rev_8_21_14_2_50_48_46]PIW48737.1 MAG: hypothetical protein COW20_08285 [bacterium (Candidatus Blackallbacteria) CG13_big_fil_rev_8_21_14_2_50_49_14]
MFKLNAFVLLFFCLTQTACQSVGNTLQVGQSSPTSATTSSSEERTLENCGTQSSGELNAFFQDFRCVTLSRNGSNTQIFTQDLPPHRSHYYGANHPNYTPFDTRRGSNYHANPNLLQTQSVTVSIPDQPVPRAHLKISSDLVDGVVGGQYDYPMGPVGVALDGVLLFNPLAAPGDDIENEKYTFDSYNSHPEMRGAYHYHTVSRGPLEVLQKLGKITDPTPGAAKIEIYGMMCDGTVVLGCTEMNGDKPATSDFDAQNGHVHDLKDASGKVLFANRYHSHVCEQGLNKLRKFTPEIQYYDRCTVTQK